MVFSSILFVFLYLPVTLVLYFVTPTRLRNGLLFLASIGFYFWGSGGYTLVLLFSIVSNFYLSHWIRNRRFLSPQTLVIVGVAVNVGLLGYYKYANFLIAIASRVLVAADQAPLPPGEVALPVGISFFTFLGISYLVDVYRGVVDPPKGLIDFGFYKSFFPQLIAGPIVRYVEIAKEIADRRPELDLLFQGAFRFSIGLGKKALIADRMGVTADRIFALHGTDLTAPLAWLGILCYTLQIYFDFSGYSDMAIGLGHVFGFHFPENFDQPYRAQNVTEFWRRWHMTLSRWFRDYLYIPMGGNRHGPIRTYANLWTVFLLCGLWHGAGWTFIAWGAYYGVLLVAERLLLDLFGVRPSGLPGVALTFVLVVVGWVLFRSDSLTHAYEYLVAMVGGGGPGGIYGFPYYFTHDVAFFLVLGFAISWWPFEKHGNWRGIDERLVWVKSVLSLVLLVLSAAAMSTGGFNPFIYFRF